MNIHIWHEEDPSKQNWKAYPKGMHDALASIFDNTKNNITLGWIDQPDQGFPQDVLDNADLVIYWAHRYHGKLTQETADRICERVKQGMGIIFLHSAHPSKPCTKIFEGSGSLRWREDNQFERLFNVNPKHPIATDIPESIYIAKDEMYGEYFDVNPDEIVFLGWYPGGELFRSGITKYYGEGRAFYFQPGHETFPVYYNETIRKIISNAALWATKQPVPSSEVSFVKSDCDHVQPFVKSLKTKVCKKEVRPQKTK